MKNISRFLTALGLSFVFTLALSQPVWAENNADLPTEKILKSELAEAQDRKSTRLNSSHL